MEKLPVIEEFSPKITPNSNPYVTQKDPKFFEICQGHFSGYYMQIKNEIDISINNSKN